MGDFLCRETLKEFGIPILATVIGGFITLYLTTRATRKASRRDSLLDLAGTIERFRFYYECWYIHGHWTMVFGINSDKDEDAGRQEVYRHYLEEVEKDKGRLVAIKAALVAYFPEKVIGPLQAAIGELLGRTSFSVEEQTPFGDVNNMVAAIRILIPDLLQEYT